MVPLASLLVALPVIVSVTANDYSASLDFSMGKGEKHIEGVTGIDADDLKFYDRNYDSSEASRLAARDVAQEVEEQGAVLLKNESSALPIAKKSSITPFGYRYVPP